MNRRAWWASGIGAAVAALGTMGPLAIATPTETQPWINQVSQPTLDENLTAFRSGLEQFRQGDEDVLPNLRACAERCATQGRADVRDVLGFFARMPAAVRQQGWQIEQRYNQLYQQVQNARSTRIPVAEWRVMRETILSDLKAIVEESSQAADFTPAARALALRALLYRERVLEDFEINESISSTWIADGERAAREALELFNRAGMRTPQLEPSWTLGWFERVRDHWDVAEETFEDVFAQATSLGRKEYQARALKGLLSLAYAAGDHDTTSRLLNELAQVEAPKLSWDLAVRHCLLLAALDEPQRAAEFLVRNKPTDAVLLDEWHVLMEGVLTRKGDVEGAAAHENYLRARAKDVGSTPAIELAVAKVDLRKGQAAEVLSRLDDPALSSRLAPRTRAILACLRGRALLDLGRPAEAAPVLQKALELGEAVEASLSESDLGGATSTVIGEVVGLETPALLAQALVEQGDHLGAAWVIEKWQTRKLRDSLGTNTSPELTREDIISWADAYEAGLVTWVIGAETSVVVHVLRGGDARGAVLPVSRLALENAVRRIRESAIAGQAATVASLASEIQEAILPPDILSPILRVAHQECPRILFCAHGPLESLPVHLLPMFLGTGGSQLVPLVLPGILEPTPGPPVRPEDIKQWSILGDPIDANGMVSLPGARAELTQVAALYPGSVVVGQSSFGRTAFAEALGTGRPLHVATHLRADTTNPHSVKSRWAHAGLELSGGARFDVADIKDAHPRLPLAVLDACETGGGDFLDAEASIGVTLVFLQSGTRNLLVTSWPVEDRAAQQFALAFHRALLAGSLPSVAAAAARDFLRSTGASAADWAAFRLVGRD